RLWWNFCAIHLPIENGTMAFGLLNIGRTPWFSSSVVVWNTHVPGVVTPMSLRKEASVPELACGRIARIAARLLPPTWFQRRAVQEEMAWGWAGGRVCGALVGPVIRVA